MKAVYVEWEDACDLDTTPWSDIDDVDYTPLLVTQVGLVVYDGPEGMILTNALLAVSTVLDHKFLKE
jgi:hypothetical protein